MKSRRLPVLFLFCIAATIGVLKTFAQKKVNPNKNKPNIIYILADDMGYGDPQCYNSQGKIPTPSIDQLAEDGMRFTDAHSASSVCTPSRYALLTGRYAWRTKLQSFVLYGYSAPLIEPGILTVPSFLKAQGYQTACIGKWHLGMNWASKKGKYGTELKEDEVDFSRPVKQSPVHYGFDYFFGISASLDMPPYVYIENDRAVEVPEEKTTGKEFNNFRAGLKAKDYDLTTTLVTLSNKSTDYIRTNKDKPFFLYLALPSPHTPLVTGKAFRGKSGINDYADYVMETDWVVGEIMEVLQKEGIAENTMVIFTSDNGYAPYADYATLKKHGHEPSGIYRGAKADIYEGGHRVPFVVRWPRMVKAGAVNKETTCQTDLMKTLADMLQVKLPQTAGVDSYSILSLLKGAQHPVREATVHHAIDGNFAIRQGKWKLILCAGSGGWSAPTNKDAVKQGLPDVQLYDLLTDPAEKNNLQAEYPAVVKQLTALLKWYVQRGRSTPGMPMKNDVPVDIWKQGLRISTESN
mgnify:FL=1